MRPQILVGFVLGVLVIAAVVMAPIFRSADQKRAQQAQMQAELACRQLARINVGLPRLNVLTDPGGLQGTDLAAAVDAANDVLSELSRKSADGIRQVQEQAERDGLPVPQMQALVPNADGVREALHGFESAVRDNEALLNAAVAEAQTARGTDSSVLNVAHVLGMAKYVEAALLLAEAEAVRNRQAAAEAELLATGAKWKLTRGQADHFRGLDVAPILSQLKSDLTELSQERKVAADRVASLEAVVRERETALYGAAATGDAGIVQRMKDARARLLALEERGFKAGQDEGPEGFNAYREQYLKLTQELRELEEQEQELRYGGRHGARLIGQDLATAEVEGGEVVVGLEDLKSQLATAQEVAARLNQANVSVEDHVVYVRKTGENADEEIQRYQARGLELETRQKELVEQIAALNKEAETKETEAIKAARAAAQAFQQAQNAARSWVSAAREVRSKRDPNGQNTRLKLLLDDPYVEQVSQSAQAASLVLLGRVYAQRIDANRALIEDMKVFSEINPALQFDPADAETSIDEARAAAEDELATARDIYEQLAGRPPQSTSWVPQAALAAAAHLSWRVNPEASVQYGDDEEGSFRDLAAHTIQRAVDQRELSPYLRMYVKFREFLGSAAGARGAPEEEDFFGEEEDFFGEEEDEDVFIDEE